VKIVFNSQFLNHPGNRLEGAYRLKKFLNAENVKNITKNGEKYLSLVHTPDYIKKIKQACLAEKILAEVQLSTESFKSACLAAGLAVYASRKGAFAVVRPPGHHASKDKASGFCLFNNLAIAVQNLLNKGKKAAILDIDIHHGDGTQSIFSGKKNVFYASLHQENAFPGTGYNSFKNVLNILLPQNTDDNLYLKNIKKAVKEIKKRKFNILAVSAGFDTFKKDKLMGFSLNLKTYKEIGKLVKKNFKKSFAILEGGYHNKIKDCVKNFVNGVNTV